MEILVIIANLLSSALLAGGVLALAGVGETVSERAGVFNLGIEGFIAVGAIAAVATAAATQSLVLATLAAGMSGVALGLLFGLSTVVLRVDQVVAGLAFTFIGTGLAFWLGAPYAGKLVPATYPKLEFPLLSDIPLFGEALFNHEAPIYLAFIVFPIAVHLVLFHTRLGLSVLAIGENPDAAAATGISVIPIRLLCVVFGCLMSGLAGAYLTLVFIPNWSETIVAGRGWIALTLVIFAGYKPLNISMAALFFGLITAFGFSAQSWGWTVPSVIFSALPYVATLMIMFLPLWRRGRRRRTMRPASLGVPYFRE